MDRKFKLFVSYRHSDSHAVARIVHFLTVVFGKDEVFHDTSTIPAGADFRKALVKAVNNSEIVLAVIGPTWIESFGQRRNAEKGDVPDWVLVELSEAFDRNILVIPVLIHPAVLPGRELLPEEIQQLAFRQARVVWPDPSFENSVHQIVDEIQRILDGDQPKSREELKSIPNLSRTGVGLAPLEERKESEKPTPRTSTIRVASIVTTIIICVASAVGLALFRPEKPPIRSVDASDHVGSQLEEPNTSQKSQIVRTVNAYRAKAPTPIRERSTRSTEQGTLGLPDFSAFEVLSDEFIWDIRGFSQRNPDDPPFTSFAILHRRFRFQKIVDCSEIRFEGRTTGSDLFLRCVSHPDLSQEFVSQSPRIVGKTAMRVRQLAIDISAVPVGQETTIEYEGTYWDSLQIPDERWFGAIGYSGSDLIRMIVIFSETKPFTSYHLMTARTRNDPPEDFLGKSVFYSNDSNLFAYWEIPFVEADRVYQFRWKW